MEADIPKILFPELFIGFVAPVGANIDSSVLAFKEYFEANGYRAEELKVTDIFPIFEKYITPRLPLSRNSEWERFHTYIKYGDQLREHFSDDSILTKTAVGRILRRRVHISTAKEKPFTRIVYLIRQFKRKEEITFLRSIYGRLFFQVSVYSRRGARVDTLSRIFAHSDSSFNSDAYRDKAEEIVQIDENEITDEHGQRVGEIFHDADFIINADIEKPVEEQVIRFCELLFGSNRLSPTRLEYGMFIAKAAALRTLDLSRQVGAAIFSLAGEVLAIGSNEVPRAEGGTYWADERFDDRDYRRGEDANYRRKRENLINLLQLIGKARDEIDVLLNDERIQKSKIMDALEYSRIIHAEMSAITDAARLGIAVKGGILYCTTFPCHMCAKHIVASGISKVVFLEPYPKSLAPDLHTDAIKVESGERGKYQHFPFVSFEHFYGISPRRYRDLFERGRRKDRHGKFQDYIDGKKRPNIDYRNPFYNEMEKQTVDDNVEIIKRAIAEIEQHKEKS
jgi:deoxycytidylate deaminase